MKIHILRAESITPIGLYIERHRTSPESYQPQLEFASVLLYREREYRAMNNSNWFFHRKKPAPSVDSPFQPFDITDEAAADLAAIFGDSPSESATLNKDDLFGLKDAAVEAIGRVLRPVKSHGLGWLIYARLLTDVCRYNEAISAADQAMTLGERAYGSALASHAALLGDIKRKPLENERKLNRAMDSFAERLRKLALRVRTQVEGDTFTRFLSTELAFCERERDAAHESFDESRVPAALRALVPLARQIGVGDDVCRGIFISRIRARDRREAARTIREHGPAIDEWLASIGPPPYNDEAEAFFWLLAAADDLDG
jgi:hypothetical protein